MPRVSSGWVQQTLNSADIQLTKQRRAELSAKPHTVWKNTLKRIKFRFYNINAAQVNQHNQRLCAFAQVFVPTDSTVQGLNVMRHKE